MYKVIFLEVDGVLTTEDRPSRLDRKLLSNFASFVNFENEKGTIDVDIVFISPWAREWNTSMYLKHFQDDKATELDEEFRKFNLKAEEKIDWVDDWDKDYQIRKFLKRHRETNHYLIIDTQQYAYGEVLSKHYLYVNKKRGFQKSDIKQADSLLGRYRDEERIF